MLLDKVRDTIKKQHLIEYGDNVICAVSGGADSICLLHIMQALKDEYNLSVYVANVNHLLRGEESDRDSNFVKSVCKAANVKCFYKEYNIKEIAKVEKIGEEECGRNCRYEFFNEISHQLGGAKIATAHNLNDNAETIIFRLVRGASSEGLSGIKYKRENIVRPLLDISRNEIENYLLKNGISWCEDSTNALDIYNRNKIRNLVMPIFNEISSNAITKIVNAAKLISEDENYLSAISRDAVMECFFDSYINSDILLNYPLPIKRRVISKILKTWCVKEVSYQKVERFIEFLEKESGKQFDINADSYAEKSYNKIYLCNKHKNNENSFFISSDTVLTDKSWEISVRITNIPTQKKGNNIAIFDADKLSFPLKVRYRSPGDKMRISGLNGSKKISDIFSDEKIEKHLRENIPLIEKDGNVIYLCGIRQSDLYEVTDNTRNFLEIKYNNTKERLC